jgi:chemotaxis protein MotB
VEIVPRRRTLDEVRLTLDAELAPDVKAHRAEVTMDPRGLVVSMPEDAAFPVASTDVSPAALALVSRVAAAVQRLPNGIRVEGHTDNIPIRTPKYGSNWELSTARASAVVAYLVQHTRIEPARLSAAGYGEFHPRVANDTPANRARNRRIDIIILEDHAGSIP